MLKKSAYLLGGYNNVLYFSVMNKVRLILSVIILWAIACKKDKDDDDQKSDEYTVVSGYVINQYTGNPVEGVYVNLYARSAVYMSPEYSFNTCYTDNNGYFELKVNIDQRAINQYYERANTSSINLILGVGLMDSIDLTWAPIYYYIKEKIPIGEKTEIDSIIEVPRSYIFVFEIQTTETISGIDMSLFDSTYHIVPEKNENMHYFTHKSTFYYLDIIPEEVFFQYTLCPLDSTIQDTFRKRAKTFEGEPYEIKKYYND